MKNSKPHMRCAQCGRTYTKSQWRTNDYWCPSCQKYVCHDCIVPRAEICSACGSTVNRWAKDIFHVGLLCGFLLSPFVGLIVYLYGFLNLGFVIFMVFTGLCFLTAGSGYWLIKERQEIHKEKLSRLPEGVVPFAKRAGHSEYEVAQKIEKYQQKRMGIVPYHYYEGLVGNWTLPVLSQENMEKIYSKFFSNSIGVAIVLIFIGVIVAGVGLIYNRFEFTTNSFTAAGVGSIIIMIGLLAYVGGALFLDQYKEEAKIETRAGWKTIGRTAALKATEEFLKKNNEYYTKKKVSYPGSDSTTTPAFKYEFENGNYIMVNYIEYKSGLIIAGVVIGFTFTNYIHAKNLQKDLDEFLGERDLIERF